MIPQLVQRLTQYRRAANGVELTSPEDATAIVLAADPYDLLLYAEDEWMNAGPYLRGLHTRTAREALVETGAFHDVAVAEPRFGWNHLISAYVLENTRAVQILRRVVRAFRNGESLGVPSPATQRWLDVSEVLLFSAPTSTAALAVSSARPDAEAVRRNAYWRMFGLELAFGDEEDRAPTYEKATVANLGFVPAFENLLVELQHAMVAGQTEPVRHGRNETIFRLSVELGSMLRSRRQGGLLAREELSAATILGWVELAFSANTCVVLDVGAQAGTAWERLQRMGERVGLSAHARSRAFFEVHTDLSLFLRTLEEGIADAYNAPVLYETPAPDADPVSEWQPIGETSRRVIVGWAAATGRDL